MNNILGCELKKKLHTIKNEYIHHFNDYLNNRYYADDKVGFMELFWSILAMTKLVFILNCINSGC